MTDAEAVTQVLLTPEGRLSHVPATALQLLNPGAGPQSSDAAHLLGLAPDVLAALLEQARRGHPARTFVSRLPQTGSGATPICLRVSAALHPDGFVLSLVDLTALLEGAPPLQLAGLSAPLSHELRNPLSSVKMAVQTLARNPALPERDQRRIAIAHREVRTLERMLWVLSEVGRETPAFLEPVPLATLLTEATELIAPELAEHGVEPVSPPQDARDLVIVDRARTRVVLAQLVLTVARANLPLTRLPVACTSPSENALQLQLSCPGIRVDADERSRAFVPFAFAPTRTQGLLLPALQTVMRAQQGHVEVMATEPSGVRYALTFRTAPR